MSGARALKADRLEKPSGKSQSLPGRAAELADELFGLGLARLAKQRAELILKSLSRKQGLPSCCLHSRAFRSISFLVIVVRYQI